MIGIVLIGHAHIASEMLIALQHVVGEEPLIASVDVGDDYEPESLAKVLNEKIKACDVGKGVLLLADMFGGTPCNIAMGCLKPGHVEVISGFNLPLLIKATSLRHHEKDLKVLADQVVVSGKQYIQIAQQLNISRATECGDV
ncbi:PTS system fructose subfamily IIA component [Mariprofundus sp. EBB-1]|uniref:PTS sugar transporter subunit IIA n=1 Tax=Mariprofundus sp. EBB-1 TaxID=2650971 RepID=UPI000EF1EDF2|nr:PTS system fructose subfamily IIA component [Mariprofundus sp. EBB-1]RLL54043.1 PTS system fructose subfamily IIA component [Mariprofundus sp. EBB-1]